jgi:hypothetical protein
MATSSRLNLTRDQLASFLSDHEQIKQFERLFALVNELQPTTLNDLSIAAGNAEQKAIEALDLIASFAQTSAIDTAVADQKGTQALTALSRIADALELLASAPTAVSQCIAQDDLTPPTSVTHVQDDLTPPLQLLSAQDDLTPPAERHNSIDYLDFNPLGPVPADKVGRVYWSDDDSTLDVMLEGGVTGQICQQLDFHPKNTSGVQINKGQTVMATGVVGASTKITCAKAVANGSVLPQYMLGIAAQDIPANSFGYVVWFGAVRGFNTTGANKTVPEVWVDGDVLYFDPVYPGELTKVEPSAPNLDLPIAIITNAANNGAIFVRMKTGEKLDELHDVHTPTPVNNDLLVYDSTDLRWENKDVTTTFNLPALAANGVLYLNGSKVATSGSALTFNSQTLNVVTPSGMGFQFFETSSGNTNRIQLGTGSGFGYINADAGAGPIALAFQVAGSEQMRLTPTGLGIGTSSPSAKLDISGTSRQVFYVSGSDTEYRSINAAGSVFAKQTYNAISFDWGLSNTFGKMVLDSSGNLGLGVTPSAWSGIGPALQVEQASLVSESNDQIYLTANAYFAGGTWNYIASDIATQYYQASGAHVWRTATSGTAGNAITFTEAARVTETNNQVAYQPAESAQNTSVTLTVANLQTRIITSNAAVTLTLPTGTSLEGYTTSMATDTAFECTFIATTANAITIGANGNTTVGSLTVAGNSSGLFRFRKTATNTFTVYRIV